MNLFKKKMELDRITMANGRVLIKPTDKGNIYTVVNISKNVNYEGLKDLITVGDVIICLGYMYQNEIEIDKQKYYIIKPSTIVGRISV